MGLRVCKYLVVNARNNAQLTYACTILPSSGQIRNYCQHDMARRLLTITPDDFGYCPQRNKGVVECYLRGGITRTSLLVNGDSATEAADLAKKHNIPVGACSHCPHLSMPTRFIGCRNSHGGATVRRISVNDFVTFRSLCGATQSVSSFIMFNSFLLFTMLLAFKQTHL